MNRDRRGWNKSSGGKWRIGWGEQPIESKDRLASPSPEIPIQSNEKEKTKLSCWFTPKGRTAQKKVARRPWVVRKLSDRTNSSHLHLHLHAGPLVFSTGEQRRRATVFKRGWIRRAVAAGTTVIFARLMQDVCCKEESGRTTAAAKCHCDQNGFRRNHRINTFSSVLLFLLLLIYFFILLCFLTPCIFMFSHFAMNFVLSLKDQPVHGLKITLWLCMCFVFLV